LIFLYLITPEYFAISAYNDGAIHGYSSLNLFEVAISAVVEIEYLTALKQEC